MKRMILSLACVLAAACGPASADKPPAPAPAPASAPPAPSKPAPAAPAPTTATAARPTADQALGAAKAWLGAVRAKDAAKLAAAIGLPYAQTGTVFGKPAACRKEMTAATAQDVAPIARCMFDYALFVDSIPATFDDAQLHVIAIKELSADLLAHRKRLVDADASARIVQVDLEADLHSVLVLLIQTVNGKPAVSFVAGSPVI
jgi:hypothetical protein